MTKSGVRGRFASTLLATVWLLAAALLIRRNSLWTPVATMGLAISAGVWWWRDGRSLAVLKSRAAPREVLSPPLAPSPWKPLLYLTCAGALINAALLTEGHGKSVAAGMFAAGAAMIVLGRLSAEQRERLATRHRSMSLALAVLLSFSALLRWSVGRWVPAVDGYTPYAAEAAPADRRANDPTFRGVILFVQRVPEKITPPAPQKLRSGLADPRRQPLEIPFSGVYWFLRAPDRLPPVTSLIQHGSPDQLFYRAADMRPLTMEAHQHLGQRIDIECCARLDLDLVNVDRYPGSVRVEVILADTTGVGPRISLGLVPVESTRLRIYGEVTPRQETLRYPIPPSVFGYFDEITVKFHLGATRNPQSARMAIQRFTLRPRGV